MDNPDKFVTDEDTSEALTDVGPVTEDEKTRADKELEDILVEVR